MAFLKVIQGVAAGQMFELPNDRTVLGRHPSCQIVLDSGSVSRHHAQITGDRGVYTIEDLRSRNGTQVNGTSIRGKTRLRHGDEVRLCDYGFNFISEESSSSGREHSSNREVISSVPASGLSGLRGTITYDESVSEKLVPPPFRTASTGSSVIAALDAGSAARGLRLNVRPEAKLRAIIEISTALGRLLNLEEILPVILRSLFKIFPQAEHGFVILKEEEDRLNVRTSLSRRQTDDDDVPVSMTIVRQAMTDGKAILTADAMGDKRFDTSESLAELELRSLMCVPMLDFDNKALGVIQLSSFDVGQPFNAEDLDLLESVAAQASLAVENAALHDAVVQKQELDRDMEIAAQVQHGFLPSQPLQVSGYEVADYYEAAYSVGGDYFDYVKLPDGRIAIAIGDVAGKGVAAALLMARLHASARYHLLSACSASGAMTSLNRELAESGLGFRFITLILAILDPRQHVVTIANAGHLPTLFRHSPGDSELIGTKESGMPLGMDPNQCFEEIAVPLQPGDSLLFYTDGITETMNAGNELFGKERLLAASRKATGGAASHIRHLIQAVEAFQGTRPQRDDICVVNVQRHVG